MGHAVGAVGSVIGTVLLAVHFSGEALAVTTTQATQACTVVPVLASGDATSRRQMT